MQDTSFITSADIPGLYRKHIRELHAFINSKTRNDDDAGDISHDVFCRLHELVLKKKVPDINARAFLYKIARNLIIDHSRKKVNRSQQLNDNIEITDNRDSSENRVLDRMIIRSINEYIENELTEKEADVFRLRYFHGLKLEEIAEVIGSSPASIYRLLESVSGRIEKKFPDML
jgi:RNA polymerase sigma factor (sigma-70 family)